MKRWIRESPTAYTSETKKKKEELREIVEKWHGNTFGDFAAKLEDDDVKDMIDALVFTHGVSNQSTMNHTPDYDNPDQIRIPPLYRRMQRKTWLPLSARTSMIWSRESTGKP